MIHEKLGHFVGDFGIFGLKNEDPQITQFMKGSYRDVVVTDAADWNGICVRVFGQKPESVLKVDFTARKVVLIVMQMTNRNTFPTVTLERQDPEEFVLGVSLFKTMDWLDKAPQHVALAVSVPAKSNPRSGFLHKTDDLEQDPCIVSKLSQAQEEKKEIEDFQITIRKIKEMEPLHSLQRYESAITLHQERLEYIQRCLEEDRVKLRTQKMGHRLN